MKVWVDDLRPAPQGWVWVTTSAAAIELLSQGGDIEVMSLDHDLGGEETTRPIVLWMCEHQVWPAEVVVHSANPVGVEWLTGMIERYQP